MALNFSDFYSELTSSPNRFIFHTVAYGKVAALNDSGKVRAVNKSDSREPALYELKS